MDETTFRAVADTALAELGAAFEPLRIGSDLGEVVQVFARNVVRAFGLPSRRSARHVRSRYVRMSLRRRGGVTPRMEARDKWHRGRARP